MRSGSKDADGFVKVFDRKKDMINRGGYKYYSAEVENVLSHHPAVLECAIVAASDPVLGERSHAFIVPRETSLEAEDIAHSAPNGCPTTRSRTSSPFSPTRCPETPTGKC